MKERFFDDVTKALATPTTRRQALRRIGGILGGTALAGLFPGLVLADNSGCAHFCNAVFGGDTPASAQCATDAAHGTGLCYSCGPASPGSTQPICCPTNPNGTCTSYSSATCCGSGQTCTNGTCVAACAAGLVGLSNGTCAMPCSSELSSCCDSGFCSVDAGTNMLLCANFAGSQIPCSSDSDCPMGELCDADFRFVCLQAAVC